MKSITKDRACDGKNRHPDKKAAKAALGSMVRRGRGAHARLTTYRCPFCDGWHLGHRLDQHRGQPRRRTKGQPR